MGYSIGTPELELQARVFKSDTILSLILYITYKMFILVLSCFTKKFQDKSEFGGENQA